MGTAAICTVGTDSKGPIRSWQRRITCFPALPRLGVIIYPRADSCLSLVWGVYSSVELKNHKASLKKANFHLKKKKKKLSLREHFEHGRIF